MSDLEQRVRRLEDRAELQELAIRYFRSADDDDYEAMAECFASDAYFSGGEGFSAAETREGVVDQIRSDRAYMVATVHTFDSMTLEFEDGDHASGVVAAHLELGLGGTTVHAAVRYYDRFVRRDGRWQILKAEMRAIHAGSWDLAASSLTEELRVRWPGADPAPPEVRGAPRGAGADGA